MAKEWIVPDADLGCDGAYFDYQELVRCRDCRNWETDWEPCPFNHDNPQHYCAVNDLFPNGDWFCKDGQRREDGKNENN